jgi:hypothetical protein
MKTAMSALEQQKRSQPQAILSPVGTRDVRVCRSFSQSLSSNKSRKLDQKAVHYTKPFLLFTTTMGMHQFDLACCWQGAVATLLLPRHRRQTFRHVGALMAFSFILTKQNPSNNHLMAL